MARKETLRLTWKKSDRNECTKMSSDSLESKDGQNTGSNGAEADHVAVSGTGEDGRRGASRGRSAERHGRAGQSGGLGLAGTNGGLAGSNGRDGDTTGTNQRNAGGSSLAGRVDGALGADGRGNFVGLILGGVGTMGRNSGRSGGGSGLSSSRGRRGGRRRGRTVVGVGDTELSRVLVLTGTLDNKQETVVGDIVLELGAGGPGEATRVGDLLSQSVDGDNVGAGSTQKDQRDRSLGGGVPSNGEGLAGLDLLVQAGGVDSIARGSLGVVGVGVSRHQSGNGREDSGDGETHCVWFCEDLVGWNLPSN